MKTKNSLRQISPEMRAEIHQEALKNKSKPRGELAHELRRKFRAKSPTLETLKREISKARNHTSELDYLWSIGCCIRYNIPGELIPVLINYQKTPFPITIRTARWIAKIYHAVTPILKKKYPDKTLPNELRLLEIAEIYARVELMSELANKHPDTSELDKLYFILEDFSSLHEDSLNAALTDYKTFEKQNPGALEQLEKKIRHYMNL